MISVIVAFSALAGPYLPFPHYAEQFRDSVVPHQGGLEKQNAFRDALPSDDGKLLVFGHHTYMWADVRGGDWSKEEAVKIETSGRPETYTTSQDAHLPRSGTRHLVTYIKTVASFSDHAVLALVSLSADRWEFQYASLIRLDRRGVRPNPMVRLRRPIRFGQGVAEILTRQGEDPRRPGVLDVIQRGRNLTAIPIWFRRTGNRIAAEHGSPVPLPADVHPIVELRQNKPRAGREFLPPSAVDLTSGKALYCDSYRKRVGGRYKDLLKLHEYSIRSRRWREVATPRGFDEYQLGTEGMFYWHGRLLFSPQIPNGIPDVRGHIAFAPAPRPGSIGLYEAAKNRKSWKRIADCQVLSVSASKTAWLVRDPKDDSYWIERMR